MKRKRGGYGRRHRKGSDTPTSAPGGTDAARAEGPRHWTTRLMVALFFASGFSALLFQVAWQRLLGLFSGSDVRSATIVVSAFLAGLGIGSLIGSFYADRLDSRRAVRVYGWCNLGIAAFACLTRLLFYDLLFLRLNRLARAPAPVIAVVFVSLLWPTTLMGLSLPLLSRALVRRVERAAALIARLNGVNILAAGIGALLGGFVLIGNLGFDGAAYVAAAVSGLVGLLSLLVAPRVAAQDADTTTAAPASLRGVPRNVWLWCGLVFVSGFIAISLEIIWFRLLNTLLHGTAYAYALMLFIYLTGDGAGSLLGARAVRRSRQPRRAFIWIQVALALYAVVSVWALSLVFSSVWDRLLTRLPLLELLLRLLIVPVLVMLPATFLIGLTFPYVQKAVQTDVAVVGQRVSLVQTANIVGNTTAGLLTGLVLLNSLGTATSLRLIAVLGLIFVLVLLWENRGAFRAPAWAAGGLLAAGLIAALIGLPDGRGLWASLYQADPQGYFAYAEDSSGVVILRQEEEDIVMYALGRHQGVYPLGTAHTSLGLVPALIHPDPDSAFIVGLGSGATAYAVGAHPGLEHIQVVEIVSAEFPLLDEFSLTQPGQPVEDLFNDPRYEIVTGDARRELALTGEQFDIIESDPLHSWASGSGMVFSREFFEQARSKLAEGGIMCQSRASERVERTFAAVFPYVYVLDIYNGIMVGSNDPIPYDTQQVLDRLEDPHVRAYMQASGTDLDAIRESLARGPLSVWTPDTPRSTADLNTDLRPRDEYFLNNR